MLRKRENIRDFKVNLFKRQYNVSTNSKKLILLNKQAQFVIFGS